MSYTTAQLVTAVRDEFGEDSPSTSAVSDPQIVQFLNQAQRELCLEGNLLMTCAKTSTVQSQEAYPLPDDYLKIAMVVIHRDAGVKRNLKPYTLQDRVPEETESTNQFGYFVWGINVSGYNKYFIGLMDIPSEAGTDDLHIYYRQQPQVMAVSGVNPELPYPFQDALVDGALVRIYSRLSTSDNRWLPLYDRKMSAWSRWMERSRKYVNPTGYDQPIQIRDSGGYTILDRSIR